MNLLVPPAGFVGRDGVILTVVDDPVEVAHTWPFCVPQREYCRRRPDANVLMGVDLPVESG
jgi:hypothetical protein